LNWAYAETSATVQNAFGREIGYTQLIKQYGAAPEPAGRYSSSVHWHEEKRQWIGVPDQDHISTSFVERQNLTMRKAFVNRVNLRMCIQQEG